MTNQQELCHLERIPCRVFAESRIVAKVIAKDIADLIRRRADEDRHCILGLATGSTPIGIYEELVRMYREEGLSFRNVITFNLDEYYPMPSQEAQSYVRFMHEHLFDLIDIDPVNVHIPDGTLPAEEIKPFCRDYEAAIEAVGGIDIQLLGIGKTGHIGFNEPGSEKASRMRLVTLDRMTRIDAASDFFGIENVPSRAITMGVGTILSARKVYLISFGEHKADIVAEAVEGDVTPAVTASYLQEHRNVEVMLDSAAAGSLTRFRCPWLVGPVCWDELKIRKAVIWLAQQVKKPILKLTDEDYNEHSLQDLLADQGSAYDANLRVFRHLQATVTGWPAGKPLEVRQPGDRPQPHEDIFPKRVLVFSPHPDDDVISMGGTLVRLADQGHEVHVAYQTSGNIAVFDDDAIRFAEFVSDYCESLNVDLPRAGQIADHVAESLRRKKPGQTDSDEVQTIKGLIRRGEARAAARYCGVSAERLHFLDMPFYATGQIKKSPLGEADIQMIVDLFHYLRPHQVYAAGDLSDPHGTHRTCLNAIFQACARCSEEEWFSACQVWLYRGAWHEWEPHEIDMAIPLSPEEVERKRVAIFKHESQKDRALFPGSDKREFWQRAQDRNAETARLYDHLGLAEYEAIEGFVQWKSPNSPPRDAMSAKSLCLTDQTPAMNRNLLACASE